MPNPIALRLFDALLGFLLRPRVRRVRRWSFLVTAPLGLIVGRSLGIDLGDGAALGAVAALLNGAVIVLGDGPPRLAVSGRTDVTLRFAAPIRLERPLGELLNGPSSGSPRKDLAEAQV